MAGLGYFCSVLKLLTIEMVGVGGPTLPMQADKSPKRMAGRA